MSGINCCFMCQKRCVGCHAVCEKYIEERKVFDEIKEKQRQETGLDVFHMYSAPGYRTDYNRAHKRKKLQYYARGGRS